MKSSLFLLISMAMTPAFAPSVAIAAGIASGPARAESRPAPGPFDAPATGTPLIPYPLEWTPSGGATAFGTIRFVGGDFADTAERENLTAELADIRRVYGIPDTAAGAAVLELRFVRTPSAKTPRESEAYAIKIEGRTVVIFASGFGGFFNAMQTLRQLIEVRASGFAVPEGRLSDTPAFAIRGVMLDVGRYYLSPEFIREIVRNLSRYKINVLHLHLTDDPAWRFEVPKYPALTDAAAHWKTRLPGKFYTQAELKELVTWCAKLNVRVIPEIDMPGHSAAFKKATGVGMQTPKGLSIVKEVIADIASVFPDPLLHIGSDEAHVSMKEFMPEVTKAVRAHGRDVVVWSPGYPHDDKAIAMCWGENELEAKLDKSSRYIDCNGFYIDWADSQSGVPQVFFQQPCEVPEGDAKALGAIMPVWCDGALSGERRILEQYPFYPCALTFAERVWRGAPEKRRDLMAQLPAKGTREWRAFAAFEARLAFHRDHAFRKEPFAYVRQADMAWSLIGPFDHKGANDTAFEPERKIRPSYTDGERTLSWKPEPAVGGAVHIRHLFAMFGMHRGKYRPNLWPTLMSSDVGTGNGTCYALTYVRSPEDREVFLMLGLNGMWGHSGGYRSSRAPEPGSWDFSGGEVLLNDRNVPAPDWSFKSLPWSGWGQGRIEVPLTQEGYFFRPPVKVHLKKGLNKILVRSVFGHWKGDDGERKWFFCCMPVNWDGLHYTEVPGLEFVPTPIAE